MTEERRHPAEEKTYAVFSAHSVNTMAEASGHSPLGLEAATSLGEDASYRLRQVVTLSGQYIKHNKRRRLNGDDFNRASKDMNVMPVYGHSSQEPTVFRHIKEAQIHCVEDPEVNLADIALGDYVPRNLGKPSIKAHWLVVEGVMKSALSIASSSQASKPGKELSANNLKYYNFLTHSLLGKDVNSKKKALRDLRNNSKIVPVLPYVVNFVVSGIRNMSHDIGHLTTMLNTVRALLHNRSLYLMHKPYLANIVLGVEFCVLEPLAASINSANDHWVLRDHAARLLAEIVNRWNSPQNHLRFNITKCLKEVFQDNRRPFYSHYGAVMALIALGHKAIEDVIVPYLPVYWPHLKSVMEDNGAENMINKYDSHKVYGALRLAAEKVMRKCLKQFEEEVTEQSTKKELMNVLDINDNSSGLIIEKDSHTSVGAVPDVKKSYAMYQALQEMFGDSLTDCLPLPDTHKIFKPVKKEEVVSLGDHNSGKSGEELLENLMEQIQMQEKLDQERKERELREQKEREKLEKERKAREDAERKKREEQERVLRLRREEEEQRRKRLEMEEAERQKRLKEESDRRQKDWEDQLKEINKNRSRPQWQQEIQLRQQQLEEEIQYSRMMEAKKRKEEYKHREGKKQFWGGGDDDDDKFLEDEDGEPGKKRLRRRKPVNYTEKDEDISDLIDDKKAKVVRPPRQQFALPSHSDISDDSDFDESRKMAVGFSPGSGGSSTAGDSLSLSSTMVNPSKGILKLKIKRQPTHSASPPYPVLSTPQHSSPMYQSSPSMLSPRQPSPLSVSHSSSPAATQHYPRSKSSSGSDKESKHKKSTSSSGGGSGSVPKHSRTVSASAGASASSTGLVDNWDSEELFYERPQSNLPPQLYSPGGESSGSDSNPHRKALKLKLKLTPNHPPSE